ncbi:hypothetical protein E2542_SST28472 [Spatholobus suberectus]|nr:hypothetical protein E2542_SST28472 [Spatholobus suberectus]
MSTLEWFMTREWKKGWDLGNGIGMLLLLLGDGREGKIRNVSELNMQSAIEKCCAMCYLCLVGGLKLLVEVCVTISSLQDFATKKNHGADSSFGHVMSVCINVCCLSLEVIHRDLKLDNLGLSIFFKAGVYLDLEFECIA